MKGPAVVRVPVWAPGVTPTASGNDGVFVLRFPTAQPGEEVSIQAGDKKWAVVNDEALSLRLPNTGGPSKWHLTIVVTRPDERVQRRVELYGLAFRDAAEQQYHKQLDLLKQQLQLTEQARARERERLERSLETALALSKESAKRIAEAKPQEDASVYKKALTLFSQGQAEQALLLLSDEQLEQEDKELREKEAQLVSAWQLKAQMLVTKLDFEGAAKAHEAATRKAPGSVDAWFSFANFNSERNNFQAARKGYERALLLAREASAASDVAMTLNNLGILSRVEHRYPEARQQTEEALKLYRELARTNPVVYLPYVAMTLNNLGLLRRRESRHAEARQQFEEALRLRRELARTNPAVYLPDLGRTLISLGVLNTEENRHAEARQQHEEALQLFRELARTDPVVYRNDVALTLNDLGGLSYAENRYVEARQQIEEALKLYRELARTNPVVYLPYVATMLNNLGLLSRRESRHAEARQQYEEALKLRRELARTNPAVYLPYVAMTLDNLAVLSRDENRHAEARQQYEEALRIYREFASTSPSIFADAIARAESSLRNLKP